MRSGRVSNFFFLSKIEKCEPIAHTIYDISRPPPLGRKNHHLYLLTVETNRTGYTEQTRLNVEKTPRIRLKRGNILDIDFVSNPEDQQIRMLNLPYSMGYPELTFGMFFSDF